VYFINAFIDVMNIDAAELAQISQEMTVRKNPLHLIKHGEDYLDKPHMVFWLSALSMKLLGVYNFTYKLPALLLISLSLLFTYKFTKLWYDKITATVSAIILGTTQAYLLITNDVRTDGILTSFIIFSAWQLSLYLKENKLKNLLFGAIGIAFAMMTKGPIALIVVGFGVGGHLLMKRDWKGILNTKWLLFLLLILVLLLPMCYGLYTQFDLHPEKEVYGLKGPSGVEFFFWTQSFGRITGASAWDNNPGYFFFYHSILWDFQPWILFFILSLIISIYMIIKSKFSAHAYPEYISLFAFVLSFLALSMSNYKLPHYIFCVFPFAAVLTARFMLTLSNKKSKFGERLAKIHFGIMHLFFVLTLLVIIFCFPVHNVFYPALIILLFICFWVVFMYSKSMLDKILLPTIIMFFNFGLISATYFYPNLLAYESASQAGQYATRKKLAKNKFFNYRVHESSLDFYSQRIVISTSPDNLKSIEMGSVIYTDEQGKKELENNQYGIKVDVIKTIPNFHVTGLTLEFLNEKTRAAQVEMRYLLEVKK
jgi:hypothetical protein